MGSSKYTDSPNSTPPSPPTVCSPPTICSPPIPCSPPTLSSSPESAIRSASVMLRVISCTRSVKLFSDSD
eukprot:772163-Rhodomonas_salina.4